MKLLIKNILKRNKSKINRVISIVFAVLPFKFAFIVVLIFRRVTKRPWLDNHFKFFVQSGIVNNLDWVTNFYCSKKFKSEISYYLMTYGDAHLYLNKTQEFDFHSAPNWMIDSMINSGEIMHLLHMIHEFFRLNSDVEISYGVQRVIKMMLEHRIFDFENNAYEGKVSGYECAIELPLEYYSILFFRDKKTVKSILNNMRLDKKFGQLDSIPEVNDQVGDDEIKKNVNLFYAYRHLALYTYHYGQGRYVKHISEQTYKIQNSLRGKLRKPSMAVQKQLIEIGVEFEDLKLLSPDWSALIGHNGHLNVHLQMRDMGWWKGSPVLLAYKDRIANQPFLSLFSKICPTLTLGENVDPSVWHELASLMPFFGVSHQIFGFEDGRHMYWNDAGAMAVNHLEMNSAVYPLRNIYDDRIRIDFEFENLYKEARSNWGMKDGDWYVCLHMRDGNARGDTSGSGESIRNTEISNYLSSIKYITDRGGWVIRMGGGTAPELPVMDKLIDYARSRNRSPAMDVHLVRNSKFFIGTTSGFAYVASSFGIPMAMVNAISSVGLLWGRETRFALKTIRKIDGTLLTQSEVTSEEWRWAFPTYESLSRVGLTVADNTSDEILETVKEVFELTERKEHGKSNALISIWRDTVKTPSFYGAAQPSLYFLEKYRKSFLQS